MTEQHPCFNAPENKTAKLWRYMNLAKFLSLLQTKSIYLSRSNLLGDPFEGSISQVNYNLRTHIKNNKHSEEYNYFEDLSDENIDKLFEQIARVNKNILNQLFVSCWHMAEHESAAMWKLYSNGEPIVAIQTNYSTLEKLLPEFVYLGVVNYVDYEKHFIPEGNLFYPIMHKRKSFEHEKEVRIVKWDRVVLRKGEEFKAGDSIAVNIDDLIENIYVDPMAPDWFHDVVTSLVKKYKLSKNVLHSVLSQKPLY